MIAHRCAPVTLDVKAFLSLPEFYLGPWDRQAAIANNLTLNPICPLLLDCVDDTSQSHSERTKVLNTICVLKPATLVESLE